jgi:hypothetical protein
MSSMGTIRVRLDLPTVILFAVDSSGTAGEAPPNLA